MLSLSHLRLWQWCVLLEMVDVEGDVAVGTECSGVECARHVAGNVCNAQTNEVDGVCIDVEPSGSSSVQIEESRYYEDDVSD